MNAFDRAKMAYSTPGAPGRTLRDTEYDIFARVTRALRGAIGPGQTDHPRLMQALHDNRRLWTALAADVADPGNGLPAPLRARIVYLAEFTRQHSSRVIDGTASAEVLVEINMAVMRGLRHEAAPADDGAQREMTA